MKVSAVIPHWNRRELLAKLLESMDRQTRPFDEVIVADNGSSDGSAEMAEKAGARVLRLGTNLGFAAAVNRGIEAAQAGAADWIAILNNDVTLEPEWLATLLTSGGHAGVWFACGKVLRASDPSIIDATFDEVSRAGCAWRCGSGRRDSPLWNQERRIRMAPMTAALFRAAIFREVGTLDEAFESYLEDVDFGLRCAFSGHPGIYIPQAVSYHVGGATLGEWNKDTVRRIARNQIFLVKKHLRGMPLWRIVAGQLLWGLVAVRHGRGFSYLQGKFQGLFKRAEGVQGTSANVRFVLEESERQIFELQKQPLHSQAAQNQDGFDRYWRAYFWLSGR